MKTRKTSTLGTVFVLFAGILWGCIGYFADKLAIAGFGSLDVAFLRPFFAFLLFACYILVFNRSAVKIRLRDLWCFLGTGVVSIAMLNFCYFTALRLTSMAIAAILLYTAPVFVLVLSVPFFGEKFTVKKAVAAAMVLSGCVLVSGIFSGGSERLTLPAFLFGIGSGISYGLYSIFGRFALNRGYSTDTINFYNFLFASAAMAFFADFKNIGSVVKAAPASILWAVGIAFFATLLPYIFYTIGLSKVENGVACILVCIEPVTAALVGTFILRQPLPGVISVCGMVLVLLAILISNIRFKKETKDE